MSVLEQYAYSNRLNKVHPGEKVALAAGTLILLLGASRAGVYLLVWAVMSLLVVGYARVPARVYLNLLLLPASFLLAGSLAVAVDVRVGPGPFHLWGLSPGGLTLGITYEGLKASLLLCLKSLAAVSCLYFLALTTPVLEIIYVLRRLKFPELVLDLLTLVYRFIFVLLDAAAKIQVSQSSRLGYSSFLRSLRSLGYMAANLFLKAYAGARMLNITLASRGYGGEFHVLEPAYRLSRRNCVLIFMWLVFLGFLTWHGGGGPFVLHFGY